MYGFIYGRTDRQAMKSFGIATDKNIIEKFDKVQ